MCVVKRERPRARFANGRWTVWHKGIIVYGETLTIAYCRFRDAARGNGGW